MNQIKRCRVCGDEATGFNYGGLANCESCKLFFYRRNSQKLKCKKSTGRCIINLKTRKKCSACRLNKCFEIGMTPSQKKMENTTKSDENSSISHFIDLKIENDLAALAIEETGDPEDCQTQHFLKKRIARDLNKHELSSIEIVRKAMAVFVDESTVEQIRHAIDPVEVANMPETYFRWIVAFCKGIPGYNMLNAHDQLVILKPFCFEILAIRFSMIYQREKKGFVMFANDSLQELLFVDMETAKDLKNIDGIEYNLAFAAAFQDEVQGDLIIRDLICAQLLFQRRENISCPEFLCYQYSFYSKLLRLYLEQKHQNILVAAKKYFKLMKLLSNMAQMMENERQVHLEIDPHSIPHLVAEMYRLTI